MKKNYSYILFLFLIFSACKSSKSYITYTAVPNSIFEFFKYNESNPPRISAHRGGGTIDGYPENCIESFDYISSKIPCIIECDVEMTKDSVMVLMHDKTLERTSTGKGLVSANYFDAIKSLKLKDNAGNLTNYGIPTLENTIKWGRNKVIFTLDVKKTVPFKKVMEMVKKENAIQYCVIITYNFNEVVEVFKIDPNFMISVSIMQEADYYRLSEAGIPDKNMVAFIGTREPKPDLINFLHQKGISTILGVLGNLDKKAKANNEKTYLELREKGVDIFATDRPEAVYSTLLARPSTEDKN
jgi:glycerophosphoryl diester phosphodiesterase